MIDTHQTHYKNREQCYICKAYHIIGGKYGEQHFTSKKCLHSLLARGMLCWDMEESLLQRSQDHCQILRIPEPKRQRGLDGRPLVKKTPDQQWKIKTLDKAFKQLKDQRSIPMVFQLTRYLAKKGLGPLSEGESQTLKRYIQEDQRGQSLKWIKELMVQWQTAFEAADNVLYGRATWETDPQNGGTDLSNANNQQQSSSRRSAPMTGGVKKPHQYQPGTVAL